MRLKTVLQVLLVVVLMTGLSVTADAQRVFGLHGVGPRVGLTIDPDQVHFGGHLDLGDLAPQLMMSPTAEVGIGDDVTVVATMMEFNYRFLKDWGSWNPYLGGGIGPIFYNSDFGRDNTELGVTLQGGIARNLVSTAGYMFLEFKIGVVEPPDFKITVGWMFGS